MRRLLVTCFVTIIIVGMQIILPLKASAEFKKAKIAVLDFGQQGDGGQNKDLGKIVAEWLITGLVETGRFDVIERRLLEKTIEEHALGMLDPGSVAQLGKILGVKTIVSGTILSFEGTIEINARLISVESASIIATEKVRASNAARLNDLVVQIVDKLVKAFPLEGYVVLRTDKNVTIDLGKISGVKPGMQFIVYKEGKIIRHPKTGEVLDVETIETGEIEISDVRDKIAIGTILKEVTPGAIDYGNMLRSAIKGQLMNFDEEPVKRKTSDDIQNSGDNGKVKNKHRVVVPTF